MDQDPWAGPLRDRAGQSLTGEGPEDYLVVAGAEPRPEFPEKPPRPLRSHVPGGEASLLSPE